MPSCIPTRDRPLTVGADCTIGHKAILHGCTVGDGSLVGMGATILNNAVIGRGSIVGANALVTEGKIFPDRSLIVGAPGRAVRSLDDAAAAKLLASAAYYVSNWKRFAAALTPIGCNRMQTGRRLSAPALCAIPAGERAGT